MSFRVLMSAAAYDNRTPQLAAVRPLSAGAGTMGPLQATPPVLHSTIQPRIFVFLLQIQNLVVCFGLSVVKAWRLCRLVKLALCWEVNFGSEPPLLEPKRIELALLASISFFVQCSLRGRYTKCKHNFL